MPSRTIKVKNTIVRFLVNLHFMATIYRFRQRYLEFPFFMLCREAEGLTAPTLNRAEAAHLASNEPELRGPFPPPIQDQFASLLLDM